MTHVNIENKMSQCLFYSDLHSSHEPDVEIMNISKVQILS